MTATQVAYGADASFALPLSVSLRSLSRFHREPVVVVHTDFDEATRRLVERAAPALQIRWIAVPEADRDRFPDTPYGQAAFHRLLLPRLLPDHDRILYIDGDTLIAAPLDALLTADLEGRPLGAAQNLAAPYLSSTDGLASWSYCGLDPSLPYFNSGVLLIDAAVWRSDDLEQATTAVATRLHAVDLMNVADQDALNVQFAGQWTRLDPRFNQHPRVYADAGAHHQLLACDEITRLRDAPAIVHFIGRNKPWKATSTHPYTEAWRDLVSTEVFADWQPERRSRAEQIAGRLRKGLDGLRGR